MGFVRDLDPDVADRLRDRLTGKPTQRVCLGCVHQLELEVVHEEGTGPLYERIQAEKAPNGTVDTT